MNSDDLALHFHRPMTMEAYDQLNEISEKLQQISLSTQDDKWSYKWQGQRYSSMKMHKWLMGS